MNTDSRDGFSIINISDPSNPVRLGFWWNAFQLYRLLIIDNFAYIAATECIRVFNIDDKNNPVQVGWYNAESHCTDMETFLNNIVFASEGLYIIETDSTITGVEHDEVRTPESYKLHQNYPNPFNPETNIRFSLPENTNVNITVYNILGRKVRELINIFQPAGAHEIRWDGTNEQGQKAASGIYFYRIKTDKFSKVRKMTLIR